MGIEREVQLLDLCRINPLMQFIMTPETRAEMADRVYRMAGVYENGAIRMEMDASIGIDRRPLALWRNQPAVPQTDESNGRTSRAENGPAE